MWRINGSRKCLGNASKAGVMAARKTGGLVALSISRKLKKNERRKKMAIEMAAWRRSVMAGGCV
jgi:hypothetical protein